MLCVIAREEVVFWRVRGSTTLGYIYGRIFTSMSKKTKIVLPRLKPPNWGRDRNFLEMGRGAAAHVSHRPGHRQFHLGHLGRFYLVRFPVSWPDRTTSRWFR